MSIAINQLSHSYGNSPVLWDINLHVEPGELLCLLGPSGSGKSTLLRILAGLEEVQQGQITFNGQASITAGRHVPAEQRHIGLVFQDHALFPHMTVADNVMFGVRNAHSNDLAHELLAGVDLQGFADRYPHTLSGGQQQRVALIRALAPEPVAMLLDEPFANVDIALRQSLREDARTTMRARGVPAIMVTHEPEEAMMVADRIACIVDGTIVRIGTPEELWRDPGHVFVSQAITKSQTIRGELNNRQISTGFGKFECADDLVSGSVDVCLRPGAVSLQDGELARVTDVRFLDGQYLTTVSTSADSVTVPSSTPPNRMLNETVSLSFATDLIDVYAADD